MSDTCEAKGYIDATSPAAPKMSCTNSDVVMELAYDRRDISGKLAQLERAIALNPESVSDHHKDLWRKQAEAMRTYKEVLGERIKDLIDNN